MVVIRLTDARCHNKLKYMSRFIFAAVVSGVLAGAAPTAAAQQVPGRDLLEFPLGVLAEPASLSSRMAGGLWNPATARLDSAARGEIGIAGLATPKSQGVSLEMIAGEYRLRPSWTASASYAQASVTDIFRTDTDPQSLGAEIPYSTSVLSAGLATALTRSLNLGAALRYRWAAADTAHTGVVSLDAGAVVDRLAGTPVRLALSTFLFSPARSREAATYQAAADVPLLRRDSSWTVRAGAAVSHTDGRGREDYGFGTASYRQFDLSAGVLQSSVYGNVDHRLRLGVGVRYAGYDLAFGREDGVAGFPPSYQFLLTRVIK